MGALLSSTTFNVCNDNAAAAKAFASALKSQGFESEIVTQPPEALAHAESLEQKSPPATVGHNAPADVSIPLSAEIEAKHT